MRGGRCHYTDLTAECVALGSLYIARPSRQRVRWDGQETRNDANQKGRLSREFACFASSAKP